MKELSHFILGVAYALATKAWLDWRSFKLPFENEYFLVGFAIAIAMVFIIFSIVCITIYWITMVHEILKKASND